MTTAKILFICKKRSDFYGPSFGLINSCRFIANALEQNGIPCKVVIVTDNNDIDKEVFQYKPSHVFIEALWVVPNKFEELIPLHPNVKWCVRIHSKVPFLANEGMAMDWLKEYGELMDVYPQFSIASNSEEVVESFERCYGIEIGYFPNIYCPSDYKYSTCDKVSTEVNHQGRKILNIGCLGAIRPMKNQLNQAMASMVFGNNLKAKIHFHINSDRCEAGGDPVLRNLIYAFKDTPHKLVFHPWVFHEEFVWLVKQMDLGLQVSFSETFDIVAADFVWNNIPLVGSDEIFWLDRRYKADPNNLENIVDKLNFAYAGIKHNIQKVNLENLEKYNRKSTKTWVNTL